MEIFWIRIIGTVLYVIMGIIILVSFALADNGLGKRWWIWIVMMIVFAGFLFL